MAIHERKEHLNKLETNGGDDKSLFYIGMYVMLHSITFIIMNDMF